MNNKGLYLAWLRTYSPTVYTAAIRKATGKIRTLGGLTDNLIGKALAPNLMHSFLGDDSTDTSGNLFSSSDLTDTSAVSFDPIVFQAPVIDPIALDATALAPDATPATVPASSAVAPSTWANILTAVSSIGSTVVSATQQSSLIALNTQRAAQGLPPVNANGQVVTTAGTAATNSALLAFENAVSGGTGSMLPIVLIGGAVALLFLFSRK
jgi:hypothetical protein